MVDGQQALADWALARDMDEEEARAFHACAEAGPSGRAQALVLAWSPMGLWGFAPELAPARKLSRIALSRRLGRDWAGQIGFEGSDQGKAELSKACQALAAAGSAPREWSFWLLAARSASMEALARRGPEGGVARSILARGPDRRARSALMAAMESCWPEQGAEAYEAARCLALMEAWELGSGSPEGSEGSARGRL